MNRWNSLRRILEKSGVLFSLSEQMITQHAWMFLSSFEKLRLKILNTDIVNMAHLGARAFEEIGGEVVQTTAFVLREECCFVPDIDLDSAFCRLTNRKRDIQRYTEIMSIAESPEDPTFQKKFNAFYRVRRNEVWRKKCYEIMASCYKKGNSSFGEILLRLYQATGQIEASFGSKMLATVDPDMPIWDSNVLKCLHLQLKGNTPELKMSNAVVLYDRICRWYVRFLQTDEAKTMLQRFDLEFPEFQNMTNTKKIDFVLWASQ